MLVDAALRAAQSMNLSVKKVALSLLKVIIYYCHSFVNDEAIDLIMSVIFFDNTR